MANFSVSTPFGGGSGYDPISSILEVGVNNLVGNYFSGLVGSYFGNKSSKKQMAMQKAMLEWQALNMPKYQKQGLIDAGYNPLLAVMNGANTGQMPSAYNTFQAMANLGSSSTGSVSVTPYAGKEKAQAAKASEAITKTAEEESKGAQLDNEIKTLEKEALAAEVDARIAQAQVNEDEAWATHSAYGGYVPISKREDGLPHPYETERFDKLVEKLRNSIDWDVKSKSDANFWWRRGIEAAHGINEAGSAYDGWRGSRKTYNNTFNIGTRPRSKK